LSVAIDICSRINQQIANKMTTPLTFTPNGPVSVTWKTISDIVGRRTIYSDKHEYLIRLDRESTTQWYENYNNWFDSMTDLELIIKKKALDNGKDIAPIKITRIENRNYEKYQNFVEKFHSETRDPNSPGWDGRWFYMGSSMRVVQKIHCRCKFPDSIYYYLVEWGDGHRCNRNWLAREEVLVYVESDNPKLLDFDAKYNVIEASLHEHNFGNHGEINAHTIDDFLNDDDDVDDSDEMQFDDDGNPIEPILQRFIVVGNYIHLYPNSMFDEEDDEEDEEEDDEDNDNDGW